MRKILPAKHNSHIFLSFAELRFWNHSTSKTQTDSIDTRDFILHEMTEIYFILEGLL